MKKPYEVAVREVVTYYVTVEANSAGEAKNLAEKKVCDSDSPVSDFDSQLVSRTCDVIE